MASTRPSVLSGTSGSSVPSGTASSSPPGLPASARVEGELQAADAGVLVAGVAGGLDLRAQLVVRGPDLAGDVDRVGAEVGGAGGALALGERESRPTARIAARLPSVSRRPTRSPSSRPGKVRCGVQTIFWSLKGMSIVPSMRSNTSVRTPTSIAITPLSGPLASPGSIAVAVDADWASS